MSEPFDFEAFISGAQLARRTVSAFKVDHRDAIRDLQQQHDALTADDGRESSRSPRRELAERIKALRDEMETSRIEFTIRTLKPDELKRVREDDSLDVEDQLAMQSVEPALSAEQWRRVGEVVGAAQWAVLVSEANDLILSKVAVPDFSPNVSKTLSQRESSPS